MTQKSEEQWLERFGGTIDNDEGGALWERRGSVDGFDPKQVWSVVEGSDSENQYLLPGFHTVNWIGWVVAEKPRTEAEEASGEWDEVLWLDYENDFDHSDGGPARP